LQLIGFLALLSFLAQLSCAAIAGSGRRGPDLEKRGLVPLPFSKNSGIQGDLKMDPEKVVGFLKSRLNFEPASGGLPDKLTLAFPDDGGMVGSVSWDPRNVNLPALIPDFASLGAKPVGTELSTAVPCEDCWKACIASAIPFYVFEYVTLAMNVATNRGIG